MEKISESYLKQIDYIEKVKELQNDGKTRHALVETYGCQQNEADSEKIRGILKEMGYEITSDREQADIIIFNTCAVREHAELRVFGGVGALTHLKKKNPSLIIGICGCMMQQEHRVEEILKKYKIIDLIFGTHTFTRLPSIIYRILTENQRIVDIEQDSDHIEEGVPVFRESTHKAWVTIMYGCNNFCSYCVVPYTRGREKSRSPEAVLSEIRQLARDGVKEITLLGQNVNSYGKDTGCMDFADLLTEINKIEGNFTVKFMTSHPKDAGKKLIDVMAQSEKLSRHLHLPVQSGNNRILKLMNRHYTVEQYIDLVNYARQKMPDLTISTDIIVGFPTETDDEFNDTLNLIRNIKYDMIFSFIYSKRKNTPAESMEDQISNEEKHRRFDLLLKTQADILYEINQKLVGKTVEVLCDGVSKSNPDFLTGRTNGGKIVHFKGDPSQKGEILNIKITKAASYVLSGERGNNE